MTVTTWKEIDAILMDATSHPTKAQKKLAEYVGLRFRRGTPRIVASAMLQDALADELNLPARSVSERYSERLADLGLPTDVSPSTDTEAEAWVTHLRLVRRREFLATLKVNAGDVVVTSTGEFAEISSFREDGRVFFKGGRGFSSWPDLLSIEARVDGSHSFEAARLKAGNIATLRLGRSEWSAAKQSELAEFTQKHAVSEDDVTQLELVIDKSSDERLIQDYLSEHGHLMTALLGGRDRYCIPQMRLGSQYVTDFLIADADSLGIRWVVVEIETPNSGVYLQKGDALDQYARKGVLQVQQWRQWLGENINYARKRRSEDGLGLFDIREDSDAIVLVGRRSMLPKSTNAARRELQKTGIKVHTYDWLLETLRGAIAHQGPPASNKYLLRER